MAEEGRVRETMPRVRIVAAEGCRGYQLIDAAASSFNELPVSAALLAHLRAWNARYEDGCDVDAYADPTCGRFDFIAFASDGFRLAKEVKRQLPGWTVLYWDEALDWRYWIMPDARRFDRKLVEYEITLDIALTRDD
jgi:hypothetical protein